MIRTNFSGSHSIPATLDSCSNCQLESDDWNVTADDQKMFKINAAPILPTSTAHMQGDLKLRDLIRFVVGATASTAIGASAAGLLVMAITLSGVRAAIKMTVACASTHCGTVHWPIMNCTTSAVSTITILLNIRSSSHDSSD